MRYEKARYTYHVDKEMTFAQAQDEGKAAGLKSDVYGNTPEYKVAHDELNKHGMAQRKFNGWFSRTFKAELDQARKARAKVLA